MSSSKLDNLYEKGNECLKQYNSWFVANKLTLNASKSKCILFSRKQKKIPQNDLVLKIGGSLVEKVSYIKFLEVIVDCNLSWEPHVANISRKIAKYAAILYRIRKQCTPKSLKIIYYGLVYPNLIYCNTTWGCCKDTSLNPLKVLQRNIVPAFYGIPTHQSVRSSFINLN